MDEGGIPGTVLMENAGRAVFEFIVERYGPVRGRDFHVACGVGNNGGDGFVIARYLHLAGAWVTVSIAGDTDKIQGDARTNFNVLRQVGVDPWASAPGGAYVKIDALLGTGAKGPPREEIAAAIRRLNADRSPTISVDIPSGVEADTGSVPREAVKAAATVTFAYPKLGLFLSPGADLVGELVVRDIGFDWERLDAETPYRWIRRGALLPFLPPRPREGHKGLFGHVLVVGGSRGMSGAPTLTAKAALRTGAGLVTVAAPAGAQSFIAGKIDEAMTIALEEQGGALCEASFEAIKAQAGKCDVICLGPGASQEPQAQAVIRKILREIDRPIVLDADGLNALASDPDAVAVRKAPTVLTPHPGECARLLGISPADVQVDRLTAVRSVAEKYGAIVVLKGARTLVCDGRQGSPAEYPIGINATGNPGMATGGSGDTLTGIIGALMGQGLDAFDAAQLGVYLHGCAGDISAAEHGEIGLVAGDIISALPQAIRNFQELEEVV